MAVDDLYADAQRTRRWPLLVVVAILLILLGFIAWDQRPWAGDEPSNASGLGVLDAGQPRPGEPAPDFALESQDGERVTLSQFRGRPVFLNFWATWCTFCKEEMPDMQRVQDEFGDELVVIGVNAGDGVEAGEQFARSVDISYLRLYDRDLDVTDGYRVLAMPTSYFIAPDGMVSSVNFGFMVYEQMREKVVAASGG
jgi:thiol-disulfide isomerase/thioredoxin